MFCEIALSSKSFAACVAPEKLFVSVPLHVTLQIASRVAIVVALVTLELLFSCMFPHHVIFKIISCNTGKLTHCASVRFFFKVGSFVPFQMA